MEFKIEISDVSTPNLFSPVRIIDLSKDTQCVLRFDARTLLKIGKNPSQVALDFLLMGNIVYSLDRYITRKSAPDAWTRHFKITIPVSDINKWQTTQADMERCLSFLTGDVWNIEFSQRTNDLLITKQKDLPLPINYKAVSLFSGGLDSLVGIIDWLEGNPSDSILTIGHHDYRISGTLSDQVGTHSVLQKYYGSRVVPVLPAIGANIGEETTLRSRSFLFISLGIYAADQISSGTPLLLPENGTMALNPPLTPSRLGSCSTRTVHPHFLDLLGSILTTVGLNHRLINPLELKTKGEALANCKNQVVLREAIPFTTSCAKRGHKKTWVRRHAKQCGRCIPCIYRRASLHHIGLDNEIYGNDVLQDEVDIKSRNKSAEDIRTYLSYLRRNLSKRELATLLLANGKIDHSKLAEYSDLVFRASQEVRELIREKALDDIKQEAGL